MIRDRFGDVLQIFIELHPSFATEVTSNVATCSILLPVLRDLVSNGAPRQSSMHSCKDVNVCFT